MYQITPSKNYLFQNSFCSKTRLLLESAFSAYLYGLEDEPTYHCPKLRIIHVATIFSTTAPNYSAWSSTHLAKVEALRKELSSTGTLGRLDSCSIKVPRQLAHSGRGCEHSRTLPQPSGQAERNGSQVLSQQVLERLRPGQQHRRRHPFHAQTWGEP